MRPLVWTPARWLFPWPAIVNIGETFEPAPFGLAALHRGGKAVIGFGLAALFCGGKAVIG